MSLARVASFLKQDNIRIAIAFWFLGLINNVLYVIILSAALDLVGPSIPKSAVLLFDVVPSFLVKLTAPYYIHLVPYKLRVPAFVSLSTCGMLLIAFTSAPLLSNGGQIPPRPKEMDIVYKMTGVVLASISSGAGELSFLGLTSYYGSASLAAWGSGTGGAGLIGAGAYVLATTTFALSVKTSLLIFSFLPLVMLLSFFLVLPLTRLNGSSPVYERIPDDNVSAQRDSEDGHADDQEQDARQFTAWSTKADSQGRFRAAWSTFQQNLQRAKGLVIPYMAPLLLVYVAEYTINQGVAPTLLFPLEESPFNEYRAFYPTYNALYQLGVFISRSSLPFVRVNSLYTPTLLQGLNLTALIFQAMYGYLPSVYWIFLVVFWEGLLGGLVYVSTFRRIAEDIPEPDREFSLGATTVSDSAGICIAGLIGLALEPWLCQWQVSQGKAWCRKL